MVTIDGLPVFRAEIEDDNEGMYCISLVEEPAVLTDFVALKAQERKERLLYLYFFSIMAIFGRSIAPLIWVFCCLMASGRNTTFTRSVKSRSARR